MDKEIMFSKFVDNTFSCNVCEYITAALKREIREDNNYKHAVMELRERNEQTTRFVVIGEIYGNTEELAEILVNTDDRIITKITLFDEDKYYLCPPKCALMYEGYKVIASKRWF